MCETPIHVKILTILIAAVLLGISAVLSVCSCMLHWGI